MNFATTYFWQRIALPLSITAFLLVFINQSNAQNYCSSHSNAPWNEWISRVDLNDLSNASDKSRSDRYALGYSDWRDKSATLTRGQRYTLNAFLGTSWGGYQTTPYYRAWIDYNKNGIYEDAEMVLESFNSISSGAFQELTVPLAALVGTTTMRVSMKKGAYPTACETFAAGEVEDYSIIIQSELPTSCANNTLNFDGLNDYIQTPQAVIPANTDFTMEASFTSTATTTGCSGNFKRLLALELSNSSNRLEIGECSGQLTLFYFISGGNANLINIPNATNLRNGSWHHVAAVKQGNSLLIYYDGALVLTELGFANINNVARILYVGRWGLQGENWQGNVDEVRVWNYALPSTNIVNQRQCQLTGQEGGLILYYPFNQGVSNGSNPTVGSALDKSSSGISSPLSNFALTGATSNWVCSTQTLTAGCTGTDPCANDLIPPVFAAVPADVTIGCINQLPVVVNPIATDNCAGQVNVFINIYQLGDTLVKRLWTAVDAKGNSTMVTQNIRIIDQTPPVLSNCPANINLTTTGTTAIATWTAPTATDNCTATPSVSSTYNPGSAFPIGSTTVTYTATDAKNNTATCSFTVNVVLQADNLSDLFMTNLSLLNNPVTAGDTLRFQASFGNSGTAATSPTVPFRGSIYLSTDGVLSANDLRVIDIPFGQFTVGFIGLNAHFYVRVPATVPAGQYYVIAKIDDTNVELESNESNNIAVSSASVTITSPIVTTNCTSKSNAPWNEWIANVQFSNLNNASSKTRDDRFVVGYSDWKDKSATVSKGQTYPLSITPGLSWSGYLTPLYFRAWIDFNKNGIYENTELVLEQNSNSAVVNQSVTIPATATVGTTTMRVSMKKGAYATPCESFDLGEVEDYTVIIQDGSVDPCVTDVTPPVLTNCPQNIVLTHTTNQCKMVSFTPPSATDNCTPPAWSAITKNGSQFLNFTPTTNADLIIGRWDIGNSYEKTIDAAGNVLSSVLLPASNGVTTVFQNGNYTTLSSAGKWELSADGTKFIGDRGMADERYYTIIALSTTEWKEIGPYRLDGTPYFGNKLYEYWATKKPNLFVNICPNIPIDSIIYTVNDSRGNKSTCTFGISVTFNNTTCTPSVPSKIYAKDITATTATLVWSKVSNAVEYEYQFLYDDNSQPNGGALISSGIRTDTFATITLVPARLRAIVRSRCTVGGAWSAWSNAGLFNLFNEPCTLGARTAFVEDFESGSYSSPQGFNLPVCWTKLTYHAPNVNEAWVDVRITSRGTIGNATKRAIMFRSTPLDSALILMITPEIANLSAGTQQLRFRAANTWGSELAGAGRIQIGTMSNIYDGSTFVPFGNPTVITDNNFREYTVDFTSYRGTNRFIAFRYLDGGGDFFRSLEIDDVVWETKPVVVTNADIELTINSNPATYRQWTTNTVRVTAKNIGTTTMTNVKVEMKRPDKMAFGGTRVTSLGFFNDYCAGGLECSEWIIPSLAAGATATLDAPFFVLDAIAPIVATTRLLNSTPTDGNVSNNIASVTIAPAAGAIQSASIKPTQLIPVVIQTIAPNPTDGELRIKLESLDTREVTFDFYNALGKAVKSEIRVVEKGLNRLEFSIYDFEQGIYFVIPSTPQGHKVPTKFVKL